MAKKREPVDDVLDAIVWMRRKSKKHEAVDDFINALLTMRRRTRKKARKKTLKPLKGATRAASGVKAAKGSRPVRSSMPLTQAEAARLGPRLLK